MVERVPVRRLHDGYTPGRRGINGVGHYAAMEAPEERVTLCFIRPMG